MLGNIIGNGKPLKLDKQMTLVYEAMVEQNSSEMNTAPIEDNCNPQ